MKFNLARKFMSTFFTLCMVISLVPISIFAVETSDIDKVEFTYTHPQYKAGDTPQTWAKITNSDANYEIAYEYLEEVEDKPGTENKIVSTGRYWYSSLNEMTKLESKKQITQLEEGQKFLYYIVFKVKSSSYRFNEDTTVVWANGFNRRTPKNNSSFLKVKTGLWLEYLDSVEVWVSGKNDNSTINSVDVENCKLSYIPDEQVSATAVNINDSAKYSVDTECWEKQEKGANDTLKTAAYWYSNENYYNDSDARFNTFEKGGRYKYSLILKSKNDYTFSENLNEKNVMLNGKSLPSGSFVSVRDNGKSCHITYGTSIRPGPSVKEIRLDGAVTSFKVGDKPSFSGSVSPFIEIDHQRWDINDESGYGITSSDFWNSRYNGKLITSFESGKSYTYGVYFKITDLGMKEGYHFDKNTKLYINNQEITLMPDQISLDDSGETIWLYNVLTMTPESSGTILNYKILEGTDSVWEKGSNELLSFRVNGDISKFVGIKIDGLWVDSKNYIITSGSTIVTLKNEYLKTLSEGKHKITFIYTDGEVGTNFETTKSGRFVNSEAEESGINSGAFKSGNPKTGDNSDVYLWIFLSVISFLWMIEIIICNKKKKCVV